MEPEMLSWPEYSNFSVSLVAILTPFAAVPAYLSLTKEFTAFGGQLRSARSTGSQEEVSPALIKAVIAILRWRCGCVSTASGRRAASAPCRSSSRQCATPLISPDEGGRLARRRASQ
jgi:hypothetical protein